MADWNKGLEQQTWGSGSQWRFENGAPSAAAIIPFFSPKN